MSSKPSPQRSPRPDSAGIASRRSCSRRWLVAAVTALALAATVLAAFALHHHSGADFEFGNLETFLWSGTRSAPALSCSDKDHILVKQNWTDGAVNAPMTEICLWNVGAEAIRERADCTSIFGIPKVAMLFLTMGPMRHETLWSLWFRQAAGLLPSDCVAAAFCSNGRTASGRKSAALEMCSSAQSGGAIQQQGLFSVFVHPPPGFEPYPPESLFQGREIQNRINSSWGTFDLAQVARNLIAAALEDPQNQRFMTISEACIPLYSPSVIYHQLMYTETSRINACTTRENFSLDEYRWTFRLEEMTGGRLKKNMWRKNHQWLGLTRKHARIVADDVEIAAAFAKHCYSGKDPDFGGWWRTCFSDEHYFSTLLAFHGLDQETDCMGELTHTYWCQNCVGDERLHPKTYKAEETHAALLRQLRQEEDGCDVAAAVASAARLIQKISSSELQEQCGNTESGRGMLLQPKCPLFARKFSDDSPAAVMHAVFSLLLLEERQQQIRQQEGCASTESSTSLTIISASGSSQASAESSTGREQPSLAAEGRKEVAEDSKEAVAERKESGEDSKQAGVERKEVAEDGKEAEADKKESKAVQTTLPNVPGKAMNLSSAGGQALPKLRQSRKRRGRRQPG